MGLAPFRRAGYLLKQSSPNSNGATGRHGSLKNRSVLLGIVAALFISASGCTKDAQSTWEAFGPVAQRQLDLFNVTLWMMVVVFVLVEGVLLYAMIRYRKRPGQPKPPQLHGNTTLEITLTIVPTILIMGLGIWSVFTLFYVEKPPGSAPEALHVNVTGHQWWFEFE